ncbi:hypothetical protein [Kordiimonas lacus]|uniref:DUF4019 domain-containing protein n=1 Tax=Kordiimonas lacus TaxID=637679 RepID=A0A1G6UEW4_9PROT|nr:hypothetical protein [Kordiimonas lacus]SDD39781.1 hypothetical protein SAMN04488071_0564 [Kordiimonas lacus]
MKGLLLSFWFLLVASPAAAIEVPPLASEAEVKEAVQVFLDWTKAYEEGRYLDQWKLTHPRIQRWHHKKRWRRTMSKGRSRSGDLLAANITTAGPVDARKLPCTEMRHCYRKDMQVVIIFLETKYEKAEPQQPEYVMMAKSEDGWKFGGGTFPALPAGETIVILDRKDEARYERPGVEVQN